MTDFADKSRDFALGLAPGEHAFDDARLRKVYGISKVSAIARSEMAAGLAEAGVEIVSDPAEEPLLIRKPRLMLAVERPPRAPRPTPWYRRPWVLGVTAVALLLVLVAVVAPEFRAKQPVGVGGGTGVGMGGSGSADGTSTTGGGLAPPGAEPDPRNLIPAAEALVAEDAYIQARDLVSGLGAPDRDRIARAVSRRLAARALAALDRGDRVAADRLVRQSQRWPATDESRAATAALASAP